MKKLVKVIPRAKYEKMLKIHDDLLSYAIRLNSTLKTVMEQQEECFDRYEIHQDEDRLINELRGHVRFARLSRGGDYRFNHDYDFIYPDFID